jgi:hypothetical protein
MRNWVQRCGDGPLADGLQLFALYGLAVAAPLLDLLSRNPGFLVAHRAAPGDVGVLFAGLLGLVPAIAWLVLRLADRVSPPLARALRVALCAGFAAVFCLPAVGRAPGVPGTLALAISAGLGVLGATVFARRWGARVFVAALASIPVVIGGAFLVNPAIAKLLRSDATSRIEPVEVSGNTPVVVVVFDELPLSSLLDEHRRIDADRYPHFASFAEGSTWYRNAFTVAASTSLSLPAILSGNLPGADTLAVAADHPRNLFSMLSGSYDMHVHESRTFLFAEDWMDAPPPSGGMAQLVWDLAILAVHALLPDDLTSGLPVVTQNWKNFEGPAPEVMQRWKRRRFADRRGQAERFIAAIAPCEGRCLHFLHLMLPHLPLEYGPSGKKYHPNGTPGLQRSEWTNNPWYAIQGYQRHLLQVALVDRLLGDLVARLRATGVYDRALIVIAADHGAAFWPNQGQRNPELTEHPEDILHIPLLVKRPGQIRGRVDDRTAATIDILPSIAAELKIDLDWEFDGCALDAPACGQRDELVSFSGRDGVRVRLSYPRAVLGRSDALQRKLALFGTGPGTAGLFALGPYAGIVGRPVGELAVVESNTLAFELSSASLRRFRDHPDEYALSRIVGRFDALPRSRPIQVAVARGGVVQTSGAGATGSRPCFRKQPTSPRRKRSSSSPFAGPPRGPSYCARGRRSVTSSRCRAARARADRSQPATAPVDRPGARSGTPGLGYRQRSPGDDVLLHHATADQVLLNDALQHRRRTRVVPGAVGVDDRHRPLHADAQAVGLGPVHAAGLHQLQLQQARLQKLPGFETEIAIAALRLALIATEEDVPLDLVDPQAADGGVQTLLHLRRTPSRAVP